MISRKALAVGIDNYEFSPLSGCAEDADSFAAIMARHDNTDEDKNFHVDVQKNVPTKAKLKELIRELFSHDYETALFYFSGHALFTDKKGYILTPDYQQDDEGVSMDDILNYANESRSLDKIILLDCCNSGAFGSPPYSDGAGSNLARGVTILTASNEREQAFQVNGRGVFTNLLLEALQGAAADLCGNITPGGMYSYIDQALGPWGKQRPIFKTNVSRFTVLRKIRPQVPIVDLRKLTDYFQEPTLHFPLNPSFEDTNTSDSPVAIQPYADTNNVRTFKTLQKFQSIGLVVPVDAEFMYFAAMHSTSCRLTTLGQHYWKLVQQGKI